MLQAQPRFSRPARATCETALDTARRLGKVKDLMAAEMINLAAGGGSCTKDDLLDYGFSTIEIETHGPSARQEAERRSVRRAA